MSAGDGDTDRAIRAVLMRVARERATILYRDLAVEAGVPGPQTIHRTALTLEEMIRTDHAAGQPLLAAVAVSKSGIPRPGFFQLVRDIGRYEGPDEGLEAIAWHRQELAAVYRFWSPGNSEGLL